MSVYTEFYTGIVSQCSTICTTVYSTALDLTGHYAIIYHIDDFNHEHMFASPKGTLRYRDIQVQIDACSTYSKAECYALAQKLKAKLVQNYFTMTNFRIINVTFDSMTAMNNKDKEGFMYKLTFTYRIGN